MPGIQQGLGGISQQFQGLITNAGLNANLIVYNAATNAYLVIDQINGSINYVGASITNGLNSQIAGINLAVQQAIHQGL
ncbi:hypothetical protein [Mycobacterium intracellulare]|uniref:hypothetical protein n=1 Tax=Mycobacterium intracellulare TaxID=1767 RepID=UPI0004BA2374|nr:hypothetical protein [Mycobacterium intracellulare]